MFDQVQFKKEFNADGGRARLVLLVSPTCSVCLEGVRIVEKAASELGAEDVAIHVVWLAVLEEDSAAIAEHRAISVLSGLSPKHYWDGDLELSSQFHRALDLQRWDRSVAWDLYLLYDQQAEFLVEPPIPSLWMHQLRIEDAPELDGAILSEAIRSLSAAVVTE